MPNMRMKYRAMHIAQTCQLAPIQMPTPART